MTYEEKKNVVIDNCFRQDCDINTTIKEAYTKGFNRGADKQRSVVEAKRKEIDSLKEKYSWISVDKQLPDNANKPGAFCPRYLVMTPWGVTEGWYRPYERRGGGRWYALVWFLYKPYQEENINMMRGDMPEVVECAPVLAWRPLPEPHKAESEDKE